VVAGVREHRAAHQRQAQMPFRRSQSNTDLVPLMRCELLQTLIDGFKRLGCLGVVIIQASNFLKSVGAERMVNSWGRAGLHLSPGVERNGDRQPWPMPRPAARAVRRQVDIRSLRRSRGRY